MTRLLAFLAFCTLLLTWGAGWSVATVEGRENRAQDRAYSADRYETAESAYAREARKAEVWELRAQYMTDLYLKERRSLEGMTCIDNELLPAFVPRAEPKP